MVSKTIHTTQCYHCGSDCQNGHIHIDEKLFCCDGCKMVFEILNQNGMCEYYDIAKNPGIAQRFKVREGKFSFLDDTLVSSKLIHFTDGKQSHVKFYLPQMHCSSCIWLLENLYKLDSSIFSSKVNFLSKEVTIGYDEKKHSLRKVAELLTSIGYEPTISLKDIDDKKVKTYNRTRIFKLGIAGFCFANIMMLSFPEYFSLDSVSEIQLRPFFSYLNLFLSLPVFLYSATEFYNSAWKSLRQKFLNIDAPIVLAIVITFSRSVYEIITGTGIGYLDSMSGIVFFMLIGRVFQDKTYQSLSFERDYKSYFPIAVTIKKNNREENIPVSKVKMGDRIIIRNNELIPADSILFYGKALIDYSFVTGESIPVEKTIGEIVYAGGKQIGQAIELEVVKDVSQSYLTQLWNNDTFKQENQKVSFIHKLSRQFTWILLSIAISTATYWYFNDQSRILNAVTAILIVACPCALLLSSTFTNGNMVRIFGRNKFYLKNASVIESMEEADTIVFDKTGTITQQNTSAINWEGMPLSEKQKQCIYSICKQSNHPLSTSICTYINSNETLPIYNFVDFLGAGVEGVIENNHYKIGSLQFVTNTKENKQQGTKVYVKINEALAGHFVVHNQYRTGLKELAKRLDKKYKLVLLSGDNDSEQNYLTKIVGANCEMHFNQSPQNKLQYIKTLQHNTHKTIMIGDGLNDAGALKQSNAGIAITDSINNFTPACDGILEASQFSKLYDFINYAKSGKKIIIGNFIISILYNIIGLSFAIQGTLSPVIAAILMPASSISIVLFTTSMSTFMAKKNKLAT